MKLLLAVLSLCLVACQSFRSPLKNNDELASLVEDKKFAGVGLTISHPVLRSLPGWQFQIFLKETKTGKDAKFQFELTEPVTVGKEQKYPVLLGLTPGSYKIEQASLIMPNYTEDELELKEQKIALASYQALEVIPLAQNSVVFLGELKSDFDTSQKGKPNLTLGYLQTQPPDAEVWNKFLPSLRSLKFSSAVSSNARTTLIPTKLTSNQSSERNLSLFNSGFEGRQAAWVLAVSDKPGVMFFEDSKNLNYRVLTWTVGNVHIGLLRVALDPKLKFVGFCLAEKATTNCTRPSAIKQQGGLASKASFQKDAIRVVGSIETDQFSGVTKFNPIVNQQFRTVILSKFQGAKFRTFVLGEMIRVLETSHYEFVGSDRKAKSTWQPKAKSQIEAIGREVQGCVSKLMSEDPLIQTQFSLWFSANENKELKLSVQESDGFAGPAYDILSPCLAESLKTVSQDPDSELLDGFGVNFR